MDRLSDPTDLGDESYSPDDGSSPPQRFLTLLYTDQATQVPPRRLSIRGQEVTVGRRQAQPDIQIDDSQMSRSHCSLRFMPSTGACQITDLGSQNGTFVDGQRVSQAFLRPGSSVRVGRTIAVLEEIRLDLTLGTLDVSTPHSFGLLRANRLAESVARGKSTVCIVGSTGVGKERLARRVHDSSGRPGRFVAVNCATLNPQLINSELFGHLVGAFSGANQARDGLFRAADAGTLFLDEIAELPLELQASILRAIQEGVVVPVGSETPVPVDVRIVTATHADLEQLVQQGRFREDLYARIAVFPIRLPDLAARRVEVLSLFVEFLKTEGVDAPLTIRTADRLVAYRWPRNVRELENAAKYVSHVNGGRPRVEVDQLPDNLQMRPKSDAEPRDPHTPTREALESMLQEARGNVSAVAEKAGRDRKVVYRWLCHYELDPAAFRRRGKSAA